MPQIFGAGIFLGLHHDFFNAQVYPVTTTGSDFQIEMIAALN